MMSWRKTDLDIARQAFAEFYRRHVDYLFRVARKHTMGLGGDDAAEDLTSETFRRVFERGAATFRPGKTSDPDEMRHHVRAWLGRIAHNISCDARRGRVSELPLEEVPIESVHRESEEISETSKGLLSLMEKTLTERELDIVRVTSQYVEMRKPNQKLPADVLDDLAREWGVTHENIRQIKRRALQKLQQAIDEVPQAKGER